jgi:hypothetical protein
LLGAIENRLVIVEGTCVVAHRPARYFARTLPSNTGTAQNLLKSWTRAKRAQPVWGQRFGAERHVSAGSAGDLVAGVLLTFSTPVFMKTNCNRSQLEGY